MWQQILDPMGSLWLSAFIASLPIFFLFIALAVLRMKGHFAALCSLAIAALLACTAFKMPVSLAAAAVLDGACFGLFPIGWIIFSAVFLHRITDHTGQFDALKRSVASLTDDRCTQGILVAFSFGALVEACAGFGAPVAISAGILAGLGFPLLEAAEICLVANTAPVAFGSIGIPIITAAQISGVDQMAISQMVGRQLPIISLVVPFYLVWLLGKREGLRKTWAPALVSGAAFAITQWWSANYLGPTLPDILSAIASIVALALFLMWRRRKTHIPATAHEQRDILFGWSPFIVVCIVMIIWALPSVKALLDVTMIKFAVPLLHNAVTSAQDGKAIAAEYKFNWLSASGTALFLAALSTALTQRIPLRTLVSILGETFVKLRLPLVTVAALLGYAYLGNFSGMTITLGNFFAQSGKLFPLFAPVIGWIGVFITGSDTSSNAIFGKLQAVTAEKLGLDPVLTVAANASGGVAGKMVSPQSIAVATAATGLTGQEALLFRRTIAHSLLLLSIIMMITWAQATMLPWMIPNSHGATVVQTATAGSYALPLAYLALGAILSGGVLMAARRHSASS